VPDTTDYLSRIRAYAQSKDPLELQTQTSSTLSPFTTQNNTG
jgi:hypothetical protein